MLQENVYANQDKLTDSVLLTGKKLIEAGSELKRAEDTMNYLIQSSAFLNPAEKQAISLYVTVNSIFIRKRKNIVDFVSIPKRNFDLQKISALNQLSRAYAENKLSITQLQQKLREMNDLLPSRQTVWWAYCLLSASLTLILGGTIFECLSAALIGLLSSHCYLALKRVTPSLFLNEMCATFIAGSIGAAFCWLFQFDPTLIYIAAIIPMVPGINLTNGVHDTFSGYYISGPVMILESLTTLIALSMGITFVQLIPFTPLASGEILFTKVAWPIRIIGSMITSVSFAHIICAPRKLYWPISLAGAATWCVYTTVSTYHSGHLFNNLLSICLLSFISHLFAKMFKEPMTMFFIPALVAVVPGITLFVGLEQWILGNTAAAVDIFGNVLISLLGLSIGSLTGDEISRLVKRGIRR